MYDINTITQGTDFTIRVRAKRLGYNSFVKVAFSEIANIQVNLVSLPSQKTPLSYSYDEYGRLIIPVDGQSLDCNTYGLEITGFYNNGNWRQMLAPVVQVVNSSQYDNYPAVQTDEVTIDLDVTLGETYVSSRAFAKTVTELEKAETAKEYTNEQVHEHNVDGNAHTDIREAILGQRIKIENRITDVVVVGRDGSETSMSEYDDQGNKVVKLPQDSIGKVDGVSVNGEELEVDENGKVDITIPQSVTDLEDGDQYATKEDAQAMVDEAKVTGASVNYQEDGGSPSATVGFSEGRLGFTLKNMKMKFSDLEPEEKEELRGPKGIPGESTIWTGEGEEIMTLEQETGNSIRKAMSQKAVSDELDKIKGNMELFPEVMKDATAEDLDFADEEGNVALRIGDGHIQTKNFNSADSAKICGGEDKDLDFADENGNVIFRVDKGQIRTKYFNSAPLQGKKVSFIGDSISTFEGFPGSNSNFYKSSNAATTGVYRVEDTWWRGLCDMQGATVNRLYAYGGGDVIGNLCTKYGLLFSEGESGAPPDCIFILAGINDWGHGNPLGSIADEPASNTTFYAAYKYLLDNLITTYPNAKIIALTMMNGMNHGTARPLINNGVYHSAFCKAIKECCDLYAVSYIDLNKLVNINAGNYTSLLADNTHPKKAGVELMKKAINQSLTSIFV